MENKLLNNRYTGALILLPFLIFLFAGGIYLKCFVLALSLAGMHELYNVSKFKSINPLGFVGYALCIVYYLALGKNIDYEFTLFAVIIAMLFMFFIPVITKNKYNYVDISITLLAFLYIPVFFSFIVLVDNKVYGNYFVWLIFISSWMCDTCAYYIGRFHWWITWVYNFLRSFWSFRNIPRSYRAIDTFHHHRNYLRGIFTVWGSGRLFL